MIYFAIGRKKEPLDLSDEPIPQTDRPLSATMTTTVKFDDQTYVEDSDNEVTLLYQPQPRAQSSIVHG